jgi:hypothetical protein
MIERAHDRFGRWPEQPVADTVYGDANNPAWRVEENGIEPHMPVLNHSRRSDGTF